jgi:putative transposase
MRRSKFSEEQIIRILRDAEASGLKAASASRKHGISEQTFYRWKQKYGGMEVSDARRLKELELENARLKRLVAERDLAIEVMKEIAAKKW